MDQSPAYAIGIPPDIYGFHPYTRNSSDLFHSLVKVVQSMGIPLSGIISYSAYLTAYATLYAQSLRIMLAPYV